MGHPIELTPIARRQFLEMNERSRNKIRGAITVLGFDSHPPECRPLKNRPALLVNVGGYRILYKTSDQKVAIVAILKQLPRRTQIRPRWSTAIFEIKGKITGLSITQEVDEYQLKDLLALPICDHYVDKNNRDAYFILNHKRAPSEITLKDLIDIKHELLLVHLSKECDLLYIHSSKSLKYLSRIVKKIIPERAAASLIEGRRILRVFPNNNITPFNVGIHDISDSSSLYSAHSSQDITKIIEHQNHGYSANTHTQFRTKKSADKTTVAAAVSGRVWSAGYAGSMQEWIQWCDGLGEKLKNDRKKLHPLFDSMVYPTKLSASPKNIIAADWPYTLYASNHPNWTIQRGSEAFPIHLCDLLVDNEKADNETIVSIVYEDRLNLDYTLKFDEDRSSISYVAGNDDDITVTDGSGETTSLSDWFNQNKPILTLPGGKKINSDDMLVEPAKNLEPYSRNSLITVNWKKKKINIKKESQGKTKKSYTIQYYMANYIKKKYEDLLILIDDDGPHESADLVGFVVDKVKKTLTIILVHCKFSSKKTPGARVKDLYEVCGQAARGAKWRSKGISKLVAHLKRRLGDEDTSNYKDYKLEKGQPSDLDAIQDSHYEIKFDTYIVQPGLSKKQCGEDQLLLLASAESYIFHETKGAFYVICSK